jgi:hypothetical protein
MAKGDRRETPTATLGTKAGKRERTLYLIGYNDAAVLPAVLPHANGEWRETPTVRLASKAGFRGRECERALYPVGYSDKARAVSRSSAARRWRPRRAPTASLYTAIHVKRRGPRRYAARHEAPGKALRGRQRGLVEMYPTGGPRHSHWRAHRGTAAGRQSMQMLSRYSSMSMNAL